MYENEAQEGFSYTQSIYYEIATINDALVIKVVEAIDLIENYSRYAVRFELNVYDEKKNLTGTYYSNVPAEEYEHMILAMEAIAEKHTVSPPKNYTEVTFTGSQGFLTGCFWYVEDKNWYEYIKLGSQEDAQIIFEKKDYLKIIKALRKAEKIFKK